MTAPLWLSIRRGLSRRCPSCGEASAFAGYLKIVSSCGHCQAPLGEIRADDFPPYLTILLVGHIIVPAVLLVEQHWPLSTLTNMLVWPALTLFLALSFLRPIKGGVLGLMWHLKLNGRERQ